MKIDILSNFSDLTSSDILCYENLQNSDKNVAFSKFKTFIEKHYVWCFSGIDWSVGPYIEQITNVDFDFYKAVQILLEKYQTYFPQNLYLYCFDEKVELLVCCPAKLVPDLMKFIEYHDDFYVVEFWLWNEQTKALIEVYHEGTVTMSEPNSQFVDEKIYSAKLDEKIGPLVDFIKRSK